MPSLPARLAAIARSQHGVLSVEQARAAGLPLSAIRESTCDGEWRYVFGHAVLAHGSAPLTRFGLYSAALLYAGPDAVLSHHSALDLHGLPPHDSDDRVWVTVPHPQRPVRTPGLVITRSRKLEGFTTRANSLPATTPARALIEAGTVLSQRSFVYLVHEVVRRRLASPEEIAAALEAVSRRHYIARVRAVLVEFDPDYESGLEATAGQHFDRAHLLLARQLEVRNELGKLVARLDFADEEVKLGIEIDGAVVHGSYDAVQRDRWRDTALERLGWKILRFTTYDVLHRPAWMVRQVKLELARRRALLQGQAG